MLSTIRNYAFNCYDSGALKMKKRNKKIISWIIRGISALLIFSAPVIKIGYYPLIAFLSSGLFF